MAIGATHHGVYQAAAAAGCDWLLTATDGNFTYSSSAPWAWPELFRTLRWGELWKLAAARVGDPRPVPRQIVAHAILPLLPRHLSAAIRRLIHGSPTLRQNALLRPGTPLPDQPSIVGFPETTSRTDFLRKLNRRLGLSGETGHAYEQVFGIRTRDIAHYRPLIEFCLGLPTDQLVRGGQTRWLARRLGLGIMPESQRLERRYAMQNADWHPRIGRRLNDLRKAVNHMASQPELAAYIDIDRALALIDAWPEQDPGVGPLADVYRFDLPGTVIMSRYVDFITGRNPA